jgi:hypothetical protein
VAFGRSLASYDKNVASQRRLSELAHGIAGLKAGSIEITLMPLARTVRMPTDRRYS